MDRYISGSLFTVHSSLLYPSAIFGNVIFFSWSRIEIISTVVRCADGPEFGIERADDASESSSEFQRQTRRSAVYPFQGHAFETK